MITLDITPVRLVFTDYVGVTLISLTARILCRRLPPPVFPANSSDMREKRDVPERQTGGEVSPLHPLFFFFWCVCVRVHQRFPSRLTSSSTASRHSQIILRAPSQDSLYYPPAATTTTAAATDA